MLRAGVNVFLTVLMVTATAGAKTISVRPSMNLSPMKKAAFLNFPILPKEILDRANGKVVKPTQTGYDAMLSRAWPLVNIGFFDAFTPMIQPIKTQTEPCSNSVVVAVVDTGIDYTHPELRDNVWVNKGEAGAWEPPKELASMTSCRDKSCNGVDDDNNGFVDDVVGWDFVNEVPLPYDVHGHGTHISGIISSNPAEGVGMVGVCPRVSIMALKYYDNSGLGYNNLQNTVRAIQYAIRMGAQIINYSGGGSEPAPSEKAAVEEARKKGILFVAAAGNDGRNNDVFPYYPASYGLDNIISVASVAKDNQLLPSSNYGAKSVHVAAPGLGILSALPMGKFGTMSGTSQATAFVTGAAALLISQYKNPAQFDYHRVREWIQESSKLIPQIESQKKLGYGLLSIPKSLAIANNELNPKILPRGKAPEIALMPEKSNKKVPAESTR